MYCINLNNHPCDTIVRNHHQSEQAIYLDALQMPVSARGVARSMWREYVGIRSDSACPWLSQRRRDFSINLQVNHHDVLYHCDKTVSVSGQCGKSITLRSCDSAEKVGPIPYHC